MIKTVIFLFLILLFSCSEGVKRIEKPKDCLDRQKMVEIMTDLVKIEAFVQTKYVSVSTFHKIMVNSGDSLLKSYNVTFEQFDKSLDYYGSRQEEMQAIYAEALDKLNQELGELEEK